MRREKNFGGGDTMGVFSGEPDSPPSKSGGVSVHGGAPSLTPSHNVNRGEDQVGRGGGEVFPDGFGGAPTFVKRPNPKRVTGDAEDPSTISNDI